MNCASALRHSIIYLLSPQGIKQRLYFTLRYRTCERCVTRPSLFDFHTHILIQSVYNPCGNDTVDNGTWEQIGGC